MRMLFICVVALSLCWQLPADVRADEKPASDVLDLVPASAAGAVGVRNIAELIKRGDEFILKTDITVPMRFSDGFQWLTSFLGVREGLNREGSFAFMAMSNEPELDTLVLVIPVKDWDAMASNFKMKRTDLMDGKVVDLSLVQKRNDNYFVRYLAATGDFLVMGRDTASVREAAFGKKLRDSLSADVRETLASDDILLYFSREIAKPLWEDPARFLGLADATIQDEQESILVQRLTEASQDFQALTIGIRLDGGVGGTIMLDFDGERSRDVLTGLVDQRSRASLDGLPDGKLLAAQVFSGQREEMVALVRLMSRLILRQGIWANESPDWQLARSNLVDLFGFSWQQCKETRIALYENENPADSGWFSLLAILDTDDADSFVTDLIGMMPFVEATGMSEDELEREVTDAAIERLVADLGHPRFRVRQMATSKLAILGNRALPVLKANREADDREVRTRVQTIINRINGSLAVERSRLLERDLMKRLRPKFRYQPEQEVRVGQSIAWLDMKLKSRTMSVVPQLERLLGPEWNRIRLATVGDRVILFVGSDLEQFDTALRNAQESKVDDGLRKRLARFEKRAAPRRNGEVHVSLARLGQLVDSAIDLEKAAKTSELTTSMDLLVSPQRIRIDLFAPFEDVRYLADQFGW